MKIFVSWSGERSGAIARALQQWLPRVLQAARPWVSSANIDPGAKWSEAVADALQAINFGILCVTPESADAPWLIFEAGALSKIVSEARVVPFLFDLAPRNLTGPLTQFQAVRTDKAGTLRLVAAINDAAGDQRVDAPVLQEGFEVWWPKLDATLHAIPQKPPPAAAVKPQRSVEDMLGEILDILRPKSSDVLAPEGDGLDTITAQLGLEVRKLRDERGLSRNDLARLAGITEKTLARIESGDSNPRMSTISFIAGPLGVDVQELLNRAWLRSVESHGLFGGKRS